MRITIITLLFLFIQFVPGIAKIIRKPSFEARNTTTFNIDSIEIRDDLTRIYATCNHIPGQWMIIHSDLYIISPTDKQEWKAIEIDGTDFNRKFQVSEQGKANISIDFPALSKEIKTIDLCERSGDSPIRIININLQDASVSSGKDTIQTALFHKNISQQDTVKLNNILKKNIAVLKGHINGYHPRLRFGNGSIYLDNVITKEQRTIPVNIDSLGNFTTTLQLYYPVQQTLFFPKGYINFYIEPGDTLLVETEMDRLTTPVRNIEDLEKQDNYVKYYGNLAQTNYELRNIRVSFHNDIQELATDILTLSPILFKEKYTREYHQQREKLKEWLKKNNISSKTAEIALLNSDYAYARMLLDYETYHTRKFPNQEIPQEYYQFLKTLPLNNENSLLAADYKLFINRLELSNPLLATRKISSSDLIDSFANIGVKLTPEEKELIVFSMNLKNLSDTVNFKNFASRMYEFNHKYASEQILIREKLNTQKTYDIYTSQLGLNPGITLDLLYTRKFIPRLNTMKRKLTSKEFDTYTFYIGQPFLKQFMNEININFVPDTVSNDKRCNLE
ncbi:hypothetical protein [Coprobacter fastidiosus]